LEGAGEVLGVDGLQGVEHEDGGEDLREQRLPAGPAVRATPTVLGCIRILCAAGVPRPHVTRGWTAPMLLPLTPDHCQHSACDHEVEGDEEVCLLAAGVDRDAEGNRGDHREGQQHGAPAEQRSQDRHRNHRDGAKCDETGDMVAQIGDLGRVPLVGEDQHRNQRQGNQHRRRATRRGLPEHRRGGCEDRHEQARPR